MKTLIVYDSQFGNTEQIAKAMGAAVDGDVRTLRAGAANPSDFQGIELLILGSPTQGGSSTPAMRELLTRIPDAGLKGVKFAVFDTRMTNKLVGIFGYAAKRIADSLKDKGGTLAAPPEGFFVKASKGPLKDGELERAAAWAKSLIQS
jgi:flavodoxin I